MNKEDFLDEKKQEEDYNISFQEPKVADRITTLKNYVIKFQLKLEGRKMTGTGTNFILDRSSKPLAGSECIQKLTTIMTALCEDVSMIGTPSSETLSLMKFRVNSQINEICLSSADCPADSYSVIMTTSMQIMQMIINVIGNSRQYFERQIAQPIIEDPELLNKDTSKLNTVA